MNDEETFEEFWLGVCELANELGVDVAYVEEEFIIDGELIRPTKFEQR